MRRAQATQLGQYVIQMPPRKPCSQSMTCLARAALLVIVFAPCSVRSVKTQDSSQPTFKVEFRLAETEPKKGLTEALVSDSGYKIYLHKEAVITEGDILAARAVRQDSTGEFGIFLVFTKEGAGRIMKATEAHVNKPLAILVDGRVIAAPTVKSIVNDRTTITGRFTREEAERIANAISVTSFLGRPISTEATIKLELRLAGTVPTEDSTEVIVKDTLETVYLHKEVLISNVDVLEARVLEGYKKGIFDIELKLTKDRMMRLATATERTVNSMLAVIINGRVVSAGYIIGKLSNPLRISGEFSQEDAERIVNALNNK